MSIIIIIFISIIIFEYYYYYSIALFISLWPIFPRLYIILPKGSMGHGFVCLRSSTGKIGVTMGKIMMGKDNDGGRRTMGGK